LLGGIIGYLIRTKITERRIFFAANKAKNILEDAKKEAEEIKKKGILEAKEFLYKSKSEFEKEVRERRAELNNLERRLIQREENIDKKVDLLEKKEIEVTKREKTLIEQERNVASQEHKYNELIEKSKKELERIANLTQSEAKKLLMDSLIDETKYEAAKMIKRIEDEAKEEADKKAKKILSLAIQRYSGNYVAERTVSVVDLPNEDMKGRIIGREGRNIRAIEATTGISLIVDDTPEAVILSSYDPIRREIAKISLDRLIADGRIHPGRIEEVVKEAEKEVENSIKEAGEQATFDVGVHGVHPELIKYIGKLKFRTSYGQNNLQHSLEVAFLAGIMAAELKLNEKEAKRAGLLHDIGKAVNHEVEGSHAQIGAELIKKYGESDNIVEAIAYHHDDNPDNILANLIQAADALSAARPGARREMIETYIKRLQDLERIAYSFPQVEKAYAIQAGRELRIMVKSENITDEESTLLSREIARKIEKELTYPGQIKVTTIRETRATEYAK
jgi:ribonuclease Y